MSAPDPQSPETQKRSGFSWTRLIPLGVIAAALVAVFATGLNEYFSLDFLRENRAALEELVTENRGLIGAAFIAAYAVLVAISFPVGAFMTLLGGFLFGTWWGGAFSVLGASIGATAIFMVARTSLGEPLRERAAGFVKRLEEGFNENAFSYMLVLRLVPAVPFWAANLAPAFLGVPLATYFFATLIGIIPGSLVYASVGNGLGTLFDEGKEPNLGIIFDPNILLPILGLAALSLIPVLYRRFFAKNPSA